MKLLYQMPFTLDNAKVVMLLVYALIIVSFIILAYKPMSFQFVVLVLIDLVLIVILFLVLTGPRFQFVFLTLLFSMSSIIVCREDAQGGVSSFPRPPYVHRRPTSSPSRQSGLRLDTRTKNRMLGDEAGTPYDGKIHVMHEWEHEIGILTQHDDCMTATPTKEQGASPHYVNSYERKIGPLLFLALCSPYAHNLREKAIMLEVSINAA